MEIPHALAGVALSVAVRSPSPRFPAAGTIIGHLSAGLFTEP
jgi:hypothetical protein